MADYTPINLQDLNAAENLSLDNLIPVGQGNADLRKATLTQLVQELNIGNGSAPMPIHINDADIFNDGIYSPVEEGEYTFLTPPLTYDKAEGITFFYKANDTWIKNVTPINVEPIGIVEPDNPDAVSGGEVFDKTIKPRDLEKTIISGNNLFDKNNFRNNQLINGNTGLVNTATGYQLTQDIAITDQTHVNFSGLSTTEHRFSFYDANNVFITPQIKNSTVRGVVDIPAGSAKFNVTFRHSSDTTNVAETFMLAFGEEILPYEPYESHNVIEKITDNELSAKFVVDAEPVLELQPVSKKYFDEHKNDGAIVQEDIGKTVVSKNLFNPDPNTFSNGYINNSTYEFVPAANVYKTSDYIGVMPLFNYTISGFSSSHWVLGVAFYDQNKNLIGGNTISENQASGVVKTIANTEYLRFTITTAKAGDTTNPDNVQVEIGNAVTAKVNYQVAPNTISGSEVKQDPITSGKTAVIFGDSITEQVNINGGLRDNWNTWAAPVLKWKSHNYAKSGAGFSEASFEYPEQKLSVQIDHAEADALTADIVVVSLGTNDLNDTLGSYDVAMGKAIADLDMNIVVESARANFYRLRNLYPNAVFFYAMPIQRASTELNVMLPLINELRKMSQRYGFIVIEATYESGIVRDFEVSGSAGRFLYDGLHPNRSGQMKIADCYIANILRNYIK